MSITIDKAIVMRIYVQDNVYYMGSSRVGGVTLDSEVYDPYVLEISDADKRGNFGEGFEIGLSDRWVFAFDVGFDLIDVDFWGKHETNASGDGGATILIDLSFHDCYFGGIGIDVEVIRDVVSNNLLSNEGDVVHIEGIDILINCHS